jgi:glycerol-3-phosphate acyltransferase PlsX
VTRIALDAMGSDDAPRAEVQGALDALADLPESCEVLLVGRTAEIEAALAEHGETPDRVKITDAPDVIEAEEKPLAAVRAKPKSSIMTGLGLHKAGKADAFISAGNTGAMMAASTLLLGLHQGVDRPAIGTVLPTESALVLMLDAGANIDCSPRELRGFAHLGAVYARDVMGRPNPRVGLLNIGEEEAKGNAAVKEAHQLLKSEALDFTFVGNVEGQDILHARLDVVACDGFVGNVVLKFYESTAHMMVELLRRELDPETLETDGMQHIFEKLDYASYGGAPLLGIRGVSIICHGRSPAKAFTNAIHVALRAAESHVTQHTEADMASGPETGAVA